jgi:quercetin 2,3-dioxygenase
MTPQRIPAPGPAMIRHVPFASLGHFANDWLDSRFHFDFAGVAAPMGRAFGPLRVWNDDRIKAHSGFDTHGHSDMEIITYLRQGAISHRDSLNNDGRIDAGEVQVMTAGSGIRHAEFNREDRDTLLYQIWVAPAERGLRPSWAQAPFPREQRRDRLAPLASGQARIAGALPIHQDATLYGAMLGAGKTLRHALANGRRAYVVLAEGAIEVNGQVLGTRDGLAVTGAEDIHIKAGAESEILLFDLP